MTHGVHNPVYASETSTDVLFRCNKEGCAVEIGFNKPWIGSPSAVWTGLVEPPLHALWLLLWDPAPDFQNYLDPCEGVDP
jgi:hypothetical protein